MKSTMQTGDLLLVFVPANFLGRERPLLNFFDNIPSGCQVLKKYNLSLPPQSLDDHNDNVQVKLIFPHGTTLAAAQCIRWTQYNDLGGRIQSLFLRANNNSGMHTGSSEGQLVDLFSLSKWMCWRTGGLFTVIALPKLGRRGLKKY